MRFPVIGTSAFLLFLAASAAFGRDLLNTIKLPPGFKISKVARME